MAYVIDTVLPFYIYVLLLSICLPATDLVQAASLEEQSLDDAFFGDGSDTSLMNSPEKRTLADFESKSTDDRDYYDPAQNVAMARRGNPGSLEGRMFHFQLPNAERVDDPDCFVEIRVPRKVGGRCKKLPNGTPFCSARGYHYFNHKDCRNVEL